MTKVINNLGIMSNAFRAIAGLDTVYGYDIAVNDYINALLKYGKLNELTYFYEPFQFQEAMIKRKYGILSKKKETNVKLNCVSELDVFKYDKKIDIDILHNVDMEFIPQIYYRETYPFKSFPITYMIHGASYPYYIYNFFLMKILSPFKPYDSLICTSNAVRSAISNILNYLEDWLYDSSGKKIKYNGRLDVLPLGVDTHYYKPMNKKVSREKYGVPEDAFVMLWVGRFSAYDKADLLPVFIVLKRILNNTSDRIIKLIVAGHDRKNAPILDNMKNYAKSLGVANNVIFLEGHNLSERPYLYSCADVFISPIDNLQETFGLTPIEAMACGVPQIVSDWDGYKDSVLEGVTGYKIPTYWMKCDNDIMTKPMLPSEPMHRSAVHHFLMAQSVAVDLNVFEKCIIGLINNPSLCKKLGENSVKRAKEIYEWEKLIPRYENLWGELKSICASYSENNSEKHDKLMFTPRYCDFFSEYPTRFIEGNELAYITKEGIQLLEGKIAVPHHYELETVLDEPKIAREILILLKENKGLSCEDLFKKINNHSIDIIKRAYMFLIKQGFIEL